MNTYISKIIKGIASKRINFKASLKQLSVCSRHDWENPAETVGLDFPNEKFLPRAGHFVQLLILTSDILFLSWG